ncbi:MAG: hypothetical protein H0U98_10335 [Alphaproteobacteria bacterium]|nr:hypothetical protein [Alphaproteobacteria bacterium]
MISENGNSVRQLSREAEITREGLETSVLELNSKVAGTIDDLKDRLSPSHIKEEFKGFVREESSQILSSIQRKAHDNPLQAVAIGAAVAYPLWGILKSIPVPLLLIGGGVLLSRQNNGKLSQAVSDKANDLAQSVKDAEGTMVASVNAMKDTVSDKAQDLLDSATGTANQAGRSVKETSAEALDKVSASVSDLGDAGARVAVRSKTAIEDLIDKNPLVAGGLALAVGAFIAASIPISEAENRMFGETSEDVKDSARGAVAQGVERAKDTAAGIVGDIAAAAAREGLSTEGLSKTIEGTAVAVKAVVDKGLTTALGNGAGTELASDASPTNLN